MPNPNIALGTLNRLRASVVFAGFPTLNVTVPYLGRMGIRLGFAGQSTVLIDAMTGVVTSPEPYLQFNMTMHLLKSQGFSDLWKSQQENNTILGDCTVRPDASTLSPYSLTSAAILGVDELDFSGASADFAVRIGGTYFVNNQLWP